MELTHFQKALYNFTYLGRNNIIIKDAKYYPIEYIWTKIVQSNSGKGKSKKHLKLFERYIDKL